MSFDFTTADNWSVCVYMCVCYLVQFEKRRNLLVPGAEEDLQENINAIFDKVIL